MGDWRRGERRLRGKVSSFGQIAPFGFTIYIKISTVYFHDFGLDPGAEAEKKHREGHNRKDDLLGGRSLKTETYKIKLQRL